jgi:NADH:ubiquinone oxidoreductase subunit F (NADH-binding)
MSASASNARPPRGYRIPEPDGRHPSQGRFGGRLLAGWLATGHPADLAEHLARYGPPPLLGATGRDHPLIDATARAGLTGRGGAGFPTAAKLRAVAEREQAERIAVANGMESEPASGKDKALLRIAPHLVLDGLTLAAEAIGATEAHLCVARTTDRLGRELQALADERHRHAIDGVRIQVHTPPHHYVSSEASALANWLGGGQARPTSTPPRTAQRGVRGLPTLVDNVETLAHLALLARFGPDWFRSRGTREAPGTALVTLAGAVPRPGVHEVEYGTALPDLLALGGVVPDAQAVLVGGYSGTWIPAERVAGLDYSPTGLAPVGAGPGAGVVAVLPRASCGLAQTAHILAFLAANSARQCGPCRLGLPAVAEDFGRLAFGGLDREDRGRLERRVKLLEGRGACKHPDGAARLAASALHAFAPEVHRHLTSGPCHAALRGGPLLPVRAEPITDGDWR